LADTLGVVKGDCLLVIAVGGADDLREVLLAKDVVYLDQIGLVSGRVSRCCIWDLGRCTVGREGSDGYGVSLANDSLNIEIGFNRDATFGLGRSETSVLRRATSNIDELVLGGSRYSVWSISTKELLGIRPDGDFAEEVVEADLILACSLLNVSLGLV
jgi:hypothetical protein